MIFSSGRKQDLKCHNSCKYNIWFILIVTKMVKQKYIPFQRYVVFKRLYIMANCFSNIYNIVFHVQCSKDFLTFVSNIFWILNPDVSMNMHVCCSLITWKFWNTSYTCIIHNSQDIFEIRMFHYTLSLNRIDPEWEILFKKHLCVDKTTWLPKYHCRLLKLHRHLGNIFGLFLNYVLFVHT